MWGYPVPDFQRLAYAYGFAAGTVSETNGLDEGLAWLKVDDGRRALLQVMIDSMTNASPKLANGRGMSFMEPHEKPLEMEGTWSGNGNDRDAAIKGVEPASLSRSHLMRTCIGEHLASPT